MTVFDKPALSPAEQVDKLRARGRHVDDESHVLRHLANISYYRLSAYTHPFYMPGDTVHYFRTGISFEDIVNLYVFDRELRLLLLDAIERLEVALRAQITNTLAEHHGPHGYLDPSVFDREDWDCFWPARLPLPLTRRFILSYRASTSCSGKKQDNDNTKPSARVGRKAYWVS